MKIIIRNLQKKAPIYPAKIKKAVLKVLSSEKIKNSGEIAICFVSDIRIKELNKKFLGQDCSTDVLAFNLTTNPKSKQIHADVVISTDTAIANARIFKTSIEYELNLYAIHGILHLLGYDDKGREKEIIMRKKENKYVNP